AKQVTINKGTQQNVAKDMAVTNEKGALIGKIKSSGLNNFTSTVQLLSDTDRNNRVATKISGKKGSKGYGLIEGYDKEKKRLKMTIIERKDKQDVKKGDLIETSGTGGVFPEGLTIGEVTDIESDSYGLTKVAYVKPAADLTDLNNVIVVNRDVPTVDTEEEGS
ncbi:rod shape-determining protein MreC, partial [Bacillus subtilis]